MGYSERHQFSSARHESIFMNHGTFRQSALCASLLGLAAFYVGCGEKAIPTPVVPASDLPFELALTVNEQAAVDLTTVVDVPAGKPIRVFGTLRIIPREAFARSGKMMAIFKDFEPTPLPDPSLKQVPLHRRKPVQPPPSDKPEHLHAMLIAVVVPFGTEPKSLAPSEFGLTNQYVDPDRKLLTFSGGLLCPSRPGKYTLRLWSAYKYEREFRKNDDRNQCGAMKTIREITIICTKAAD